MMIDFVEKGTDWVKRWQEVTFSPSHLFSMERFKLDSGAFLFASGCLLSGYLVAMVGAALYFAHYYSQNLRNHLAPEKLKTSVEAVSMVAGIYVAIILVGLLLTSAISYAVYKAFGSKRSFADQFACDLCFLNMEPIAAAALTVAYINYSNHHEQLGHLLFGIFACTRAYYLVLAFVAFKSLHKLGNTRGIWSFGLGYLPPALCSVAVQLGVTFLIAQVATGAID